MAATHAPERRRRIRRRLDKPPITARLVLDDHVKTDTGILSEDLFEELFPQFGHGKGSRDTDDEESSTPAKSGPSVHHVAIAPWAPAGSADSANWTVVPVTTSSALAHSTVQFSPSALALQSFATILQHVAPSKLSSHSRSGIEILVLDVVPIPLDTVLVSIEGDLAKRLEDGEGTFFREHPEPDRSGRNTTAAKHGQSPEARLAAALRVALGTLQVVHSSDLFPLPLPPHPVTHVPPTPAKVALCEPVAQGVLAPGTKIVVSRGHSHSKHDRKPAVPMPAARTVNGSLAAPEEDTDHDQFYSAAEERYRTDATTEDTGIDSVTEEEETAVGSESDEQGLSDDDDMDDMISLQMPSLPATTASGLSTAQAGTPMTVTTGRGRRTNGISTPMSVFSSYTATTARPDRPRGRLFKAHGLMQRIPDALLHPRPGPDDDEEARVYVDVRDLPRIGCFSGDWVRLEPAEEPAAYGGFGHFMLPGFEKNSALDEEHLSRPVRVLGLPEGYSNRPTTRIPGSKQTLNGRRPSFLESQMSRLSSPAAYVSPVLLANLDGPPYLRIAPIKWAKQHGKGSALPKHASPRMPPLGREVILQQIRTPLSTERNLQSAVLAAVKWHFEQKTRTVRTGDLLAVPLDTRSGRALHESIGAEGEASAIDELLSLASSAGQDQSARFDGVAWFKVTRAEAAPGNEQAAAEEEGEEVDDVWGSAVLVDTAVTHLEQAGSVTSTVPGTEHNTWPYYLGLKELPARPPHLSSPLLAEPRQEYVSSLRRTLKGLLAATTSARAMQLKMPPLAILLVSAQRNVGKATTVENACSDLGLHIFAIDAYDIVDQAGAGGGDVKTEGFLKARAERAMSCGPHCCVLLIRHVEALTAERMTAAFRDVLASARAVVATTAEVDKVPEGLRGLFTHELRVNAPDEREREGILRNIVDDSSLALDPEVDLGGVALKTAALVAGDLVDVVARARTARLNRLERVCSSQAAVVATTTQDDSDDLGPAISLRDVLTAGGPAVRGLSARDFDAAVDDARKNFADAIGAPKIPNVSWADVGGLGHVKAAVAETIQLPLERPELFARGMKRRSGMLLYGPPGTGKTLLAKAIATEYSLNFFSVKGPELLNMYIGESEANVRRVFQRARDARPCVVFFDELDSVAPKRGNQGDSGGVMDRIVSQLLAELDGMSSSSDSDGGGDGASGSGSGGVFVIGATNRPDLLDPALLRPGRFDKMLYLGLPDTNDKQLKVMEALTRKFALHPSVSLRAIVERLPFTYTGADFYALCTDAMLKAVTRQATAVDARIAALNAAAPAAAGQPKVTTATFFDRHATPADMVVLVTENDFLAAHRELVPSVSAGELAHYERVRAAFEGPAQSQSLAHGLGSGGSSERRPPPAAQAAGLAGRPVSHDGNRGAGPASTATHKGKGRAVGGRNRKAKDVAVESDDGDDDDDDDEDEEGHGGWDEDARSNAQAKGKGKGKALATFHDGASDDDGLYEP